MCNYIYMSKEPEALCVSIKELETILSLSRRSIYRLIAKKKISPLKKIHGKNYLFDKQQIINLVKGK